MADRKQNLGASDSLRDISAPGWSHALRRTLSEDHIPQRLLPLPPPPLSQLSGMHHNPCTSEEGGGGGFYKALIRQAVHNHLSVHFD